MGVYCFERPMLHRGGVVLTFRGEETRTRLETDFVARTEKMGCRPGEIWAGSWEPGAQDGSWECGAQAWPEIWEPGTETWAGSWKPGLRLGLVAGNQEGRQTRAWGARLEWNPWKMCRVRVQGTVGRQQTGDRDQRQGWETGDWTMGKRDRGGSQNRQDCRE